MEKKSELNEFSLELKELAQNLRVLAEELSLFGKLIPNSPIDFNQSTGTSFSPVGSKSNIIPFPGTGTFIGNGPEFDNSHTKQFLFSAPILATPGKLLPPDIPDYRPLLQRNGLILLAWDKRGSEMGERYTAYWVTSAGVPRFYASKPLCLKDFPFANPDHKSYASEDGIEFYGQKTPDYIVHVAPELMMSNPAHRELRLPHIRMLKRQGSKIDFNFKYLLTTQKNPRVPPKKTDYGSQNQTG
jgi:hypothetical protein